MESPNATSLGRGWEGLGVADKDIVRAYRTFNTGAPAFRAVSESYERR
jgi:hypothetical protein